jgi:uncharacterized protein (TIGR03435 family)
VASGFAGMQYSTNGGVTALYAPAAPLTLAFAAGILGRSNLMTHRLLLAIGMFAAGTIRAQLTFEAASIRVSASDNSGFSVTRKPAGITATNAPFEYLVEVAYQTKLVDWSHVPDSLRLQRYDMVAKAAGKLSGDQYWEMLRALLEDRFNLKFHRETKESQVFALVFAKNGTAPGPKLTPSQNPDCPANPDGSNFCGVQVGYGSMFGQRIPLTRIARELGPFAGRPVQDRTGLTGVFDFELRWTPDQLDSKSTAVDSWPSLTTAIEEQLGLKLKSEKGQIEILVIDHLEKPSEN